MAMPLEDLATGVAQAWVGGQEGISPLIWPRKAELGSWAVSAHLISSHNACLDSWTW